MRAYELEPRLDNISRVHFLPPARMHFIMSAGEGRSRGQAAATAAKGEEEGAAVPWRPRRGLLEEKGGRRS